MSKKFIALYMSGEVYGPPEEFSDLISEMEDNEEHFKDFTFYELVPVEVEIKTTVTLKRKK